MPGFRLRVAVHSPEYLACGVRSQYGRRSGATSPQRRTRSHQRPPRLRWETLVLTLAACALVSLVLSCGSRGARRADPGRAPSSSAASLDARTPPGREQEALSHSVHADVACTGCHDQSPQAASPAGRGQPVGTVRCTPCHEQAVKSVQGSVHAAALKRRAPGGAGCAVCHGSHDIVSARDPRSRTHKRQLPFTCGQCHDNPEVGKQLGIKAAQARRVYFDVTHGRALIEQGLVVAPSCSDCHGNSHEISAVAHANSPTHRKRVAHTCGQCHAGAVEEYLKSTHSQLTGADAARAPTCTHCHSIHRLLALLPGFRQESDASCGHCHTDRLKEYLSTYHGRAHALGQQRVAACVDCHGKHDIRRSSDPDSPLSSAHRADTCRKCHHGVSEGFSSISVHPDPTSRAHYPLLYWSHWGMTVLLLGALGIFGLHTLLWLSRGVRDFLRDPQAFRATRQRLVGAGGKLYRRFRPIDRFCHALLALSFMLLVATGMPLKFPESAWAKSVFDLLGGVRVAAGLHRIGAVLILLSVVLHVQSVVGLLWRRRASYRDGEGRFRLRRLLGTVFGPDSPAPNLQDVRDVWGHLRWVFGRGPRPAFDRFTYWEKVDYGVVFWGVLIIGLSGLVMWFPAWFTRVLPGWSVSLARVIHSDEALLAAGFIFVVHFFNCHFRLDRFPIDPVMFSGRISEERLREERPRQYVRLVESGRLEQLRVRDEWPGWKPMASTLGMLALVIGLLLAVAMFWAMGSLFLDS